jgi:uncharacterized membrane protein YhaH (DUF805 family)
MGEILDMDWMLMPYRRYAEFSGRSQRKEYWMFELLVAIVYIMCAIIMSMGAPTIDPYTGAVSGGSALYTIGLSLLGLFGLATIIPAIAVAIRRLHDTDRSGWWILIGLVPLVGAIVLLIFYVTDGTPGPNRFGPDPKGRGSEQAFA